MNARAVLPLAALAALAGCGKSDNDPGPGGVTAGEGRALDEAAEMIEQRRMPAEALRSPQQAPSAAAVSPAAPSPARP